MNARKGSNIPNYTLGLVAVEFTHHSAVMVERDSNKTVELPTF
jgi:hypothetical protein